VGLRCFYCRRDLQPGRRGRPATNPAHCPWPSECARKALKQQWSDAADRYRSSIKALLGEEQDFRLFRRTTTWIYRHPEISRRYFLGGVSGIILSCLIENSPASPGVREEHDFQLLAQARDTFARGDRAGAAALATSLAALAGSRESGAARRLELGCQELLIDCGERATETNYRGAFDNLENRYKALICGWLELRDFFRAAAAFMLLANHYSNDILFNAAQYAHARDLLAAARHFLDFVPKSDRRRTMLLHQIHVRQLGLALDAGSESQQEKILAGLRDLAERIGTDRVCLETCKAEISYYLSLAKYREAYATKAHDSLQILKLILKRLPAHPAWTHFGLLRPEIEILLATGQQERALPLISDYIDAWRNHYPGFYQLEVLRCYPDVQLPKPAPHIFMEAVVPYLYLEDDLAAVFTQ